MPKKPTGAYVIDWSNTLSDGLIGYIDFNYRNVINKVNNTFAATTNTFAPAISNLNTCRQSLYETTGSKASFDVNDIPISNSAITIHIVLSAQQAWLDTRQIPETIIDTTIGNTEGFRLSKRTGVTLGGQLWRFRIFLGGIGYNVDVNCVEWYEGNFVQLTCTYDGSLVKIYQDGVELISEAHLGTIKPIVDGWWFAQNAAGVDSNGGIFYYHSSHIYNKALTQKQINALNSDPYQILKPVRTVRHNAYAALFGDGEVVLDPIARDDGPYHVLENETFTLLAPGILANDDWSTEDLRPHLTFSGSSYATIGTPLTSTGGKSILFMMSTTMDAATSNGIWLMSSTSTLGSGIFFFANDRIRLVHGSEVFDVLYSSMPGWNDGEKHSFRWHLQGTDAFFYYDGVEVQTDYFNSAANIVWDTIAASGNLDGNFTGVIDTLAIQDSVNELESITWILDSDSTTREPSEQHPADSNYDLIYTGVVPGDWS